MEKKNSYLCHSISDSTEILHEQDHPKKQGKYCVKNVLDYIYHCDMYQDIIHPILQINRF